ncbi:MAG: SDR family NAD(P)-dependent oxidoreductase, partial [Anaerolineales bacterium]
QNKVAVITGAAGDLGKAVVRQFIEHKAIVCALDYKIGRLKNSTVKPKNNKNFYGFEEVDVTDRSAMLELAQEIQRQVGVVDILVNTVGGFTSGEMVHELSSQTWRYMMDLNVQSLLNAAAAFVPGMVNKGYGKVIAIGARASMVGSAKNGVYAAAKAALLRFTESMAAELKPMNIQVNCVLPGTIDTLQNRQDMPNADYSKWVTPEQVANVILFLASAESDGISGAAIPVFG